MSSVFADTAVFALCMAAVAVFAKPVGLYIAKVFEGRFKFLWLLEGSVYELCGINPDEEMDWKDYAFAVMLFNMLGVAVLFGILMLQGYLPLNPQNYGGFSWDLAVNTAVSFVTNTNWQAYSGEALASYFTQMAGLTVQNFLSAATGICIAIVLIRGITRQSSQTLGNFWADITRSTLYLLLPIVFVSALLLVSQGVIQNFSSYVNVSLLEPYITADGKNITEQIIPMGPVASQEAIKELGTNGGGFFNANAAHPFENPTPWTNILEILLILLIPFSLTYTFGYMVKDTRQGWAILIVMMFFLIAAYSFGYYFELKGNNLLASKGITGEYLEGKEVRFGVGGSVLYATVTTGTSTGAVNSMHDSMTPLGGMTPLILILLGEVCPGGVGSGLYTMIPYVLIAIFVAGLMVGRTPEYLGKKIEALDMRCAVIIVLTPPIIVLLFSGIAVLLPAGISSVYNPGPHGVSEVLYAFASMANNNGSSFGGLNANTMFYNLIGALVMFAGRFIPMIAALALAGSLAGKKVYKSPDVLRTSSITFVVWLIMLIILVDTISFMPALALGPIIEHIIMLRGDVF